MGLFGKIKKSMGIGTISFDLAVPSSIQGSAGTLEGEVILKAKSEQQVKDVEVVFERVYSWDERESTYNSSTNRHEDRWVERSNTVELGKFKDETAFSMAAEESKTIHFTIAFQPISGNEVTDSNNLMWDVLDSALFNGNSIFGSSMRNQRIEYKVSGDVDLVDVAFDKGDSKQIVVI
ncbi:MAG: sporulation protein [Actinomycetota bacterium]|nr:sporulation protein [Actinomycetota bacterium]